MNDFTKGQLTALSQMVYRGCKPASMIAIKENDFAEAVKICDQEKCRYYTFDLPNNWIEFWIYERKELLSVIKLTKSKPENEEDHYLLGALFGYSNDKICDYLKNDFI
jgi:hypothetical protein